MAGDLVITFEGAFEPLRRAAYRAAYRLLGDRATAEDVAAEALARAYARWSSVADHAQPWVIRVATNLALDVGRRRATASGRRVLLVEDAPRRPGGAPAGPPGSAAGTAPEAARGGGAEVPR